MYNVALKLLLLHPDHLAAGFTSSLACQSQYLSDEQIKSIAHVPIWFVHSADDKTTLPEATVLSLGGRPVTIMEWLAAQAKE
jgi:predicted peptidase